MSALLAHISQPADIPMHGFNVSFHQKGGLPGKSHWNGGLCARGRRAGEVPGLAGRIPRLMLAAFLVWLAAPSLMGVSMEPLPISVLTRESDLIVHGHVESVSTRRDPAGHVITRVSIGLIEIWRGEVSGARVQVTLAGGILGTTQVIVDGQPEYRPGEEVVLFLKRNDRGELVSVGLAQGKFEVATEPSTGKKRVCNPFHGRRPGRKGETTQDVGGHPAAEKLFLSLEDLKQAVLRKAH